MLVAVILLLETSVVDAAETVVLVVGLRSEGSGSEMMLLLMESDPDGNGISVTGRVQASLLHCAAKALVGERESKKSRFGFMIKFVRRTSEQQV